MKKVFWLTAGILSLLFAEQPCVHADEIVMTTGEIFHSSEVWEEGGKIRFNMQGLVVSVNKEEVARIIRDTERIPASPQKTAAATVDQTDGPSDIPPSLMPPPRRGEQASVRDNRSSGRNNVDNANSIKSIGINGIVWRMSPSQMTDLEKVKTDPAFGGIDQYWQPSQPLEFRGTPVDGLVYGFWQGQLYTVMMWVDGRIGYNRLKTSVFQNFGKGSQSDSASERFVWDGRETQRMLEFDSQLNTGLFVMRSTVLDTQIKSKYPTAVQQ